MLLLANQLKTMETNIQVFKNNVFGEIRTMTNEKGETFFVGKDVATALGYAKPQNALATHVDKDDKSTAPIQGTAYETRVTLINESGLYSLILSSKLPQAKAFKRWVTAEVLPQIRMTGGYIPTRDVTGRELTSEEIIDRADAILGHTLQLLNEPAEDTLTATQVAKTFNMTVYDFNSVLQDMGIQYRRGGHWNISDHLKDRDLARLRTFVSYSLKGEKKVRAYMTWTMAGLRFLNAKLGYPNF